MKQYKHKQTGDIATLNNQAGYTLNKNTIGLIPKEYIENSNDWQEIVELCVPYGTKIKCTIKDFVYTIEKSTLPDCCAITLRKGVVKRMFNFTIELVNEYLKNGNWIVCEEIPEYVKCIKNPHSSSETVGLIRKTNILPEWVWGQHTLDTYWKDYMYCYEPATKEEYDAQERDAIMQECIKRFPKGSKVRCAHNGKIYTIAQSYEHTGPSYVNEVYYFGSYNNNILALSTEKKLIRGFYLYYNGKYAELVKELDYEILSFMGIDGHTKGGILSRPYNGAGESNLLSDSKWTIHSVKRKSDGEVFTVGDKVTHKNGVCKGNIKSFYTTSKNEIALHIENANIFLENWVKLKQPLFKTEDGVDKFEGDNWYCTYDDNYWETQWRWQIWDTKINKIKLDLNDKSIHRFSTKEAAEEYILLNKPCLSINDVKSIMLKKSQNNEI